MKIQMVFLSGLLALLLAGQSRGSETTAELLFKNARTLVEEARALQAEGKNAEASQKYETAAYLLEKIRQDFPQWDPPAIEESLAACQGGGVPPASSPSPFDEKMITCLWKPLIADSDFEPEEGDIYRITVSGEDRSRLHFSFTRLKPYDGDARICVQTMNTPNNTILLDRNNQDLFRSEGGEYTLTLVVPAGWPLFLAEYTDNPYANPVVLSNIVELP